jgi:hypothetical protein
MVCVECSAWALGVGCVLAAFSKDPQHSVCIAPCLVQPPIYKQHKGMVHWDAGCVCSYPTRAGLLILTRLACVLLLLVLTGVPTGACGSGPAGMVFAAGAPLGISGIKSTARLEADGLYRYGHCTHMPCQ